MRVTFVSSNSVRADEHGQHRTDERGRKSDNSFITDFPDSKQISPIAPLRLRLRPQRARTMLLVRHTGQVRREELPDVVRKEKSCGLVARGVVIVTEQIRAIRWIRGIRDQAVMV